MRRARTTAQLIAQVVGGQIRRAAAGAESRVRPGLTEIDRARADVGQLRSEVVPNSAEFGPEPAEFGAMATHLARTLSALPRLVAIGWVWRVTADPTQAASGAAERRAPGRGSARAGAEVRRRTSAGASSMAPAQPLGNATPEPMPRLPAALAAPASLGTDGEIQATRPAARAARDECAICLGARGTGQTGSSAELWVRDCSGELVE